MRRWWLASGRGAALPLAVLPLAALSVATGLLAVGCAATAPVTSHAIGDFDQIDASRQA